MTGQQTSSQQAATGSVGVRAVFDFSVSQILHPMPCRKVTGESFDEKVVRSRMVIHVSLSAYYTRILSDR